MSVFENKAQQYKLAFLCVAFQVPFKHKDIVWCGPSMTGRWLVDDKSPALDFSSVVAF